MTAPALVADLIPAATDRIIHAAALAYVTRQGVPHLADYMARLPEFRDAITTAVRLTREESR
jgi:hypothetical protein